MKNLTIILLIFLSSCKSETKSEHKTENGIDKSVYEMWERYTQSNPDIKDKELPDSWYFHDNKEDANRLAELTVNGVKRATTSGLYAWYKEANANLPQVGTIQIITDFEGKAQAIIETTKVDTIPFNQISKEYAALDIGTNIEPLEKWKKAHWDYLSRVMKENGEKPTEEMLLVCEWFKTIWTEKNH